MKHPTAGGMPATTALATSTRAEAGWARSSAGWRRGGPARGVSHRSLVGAVPALAAAGTLWQTQGPAPAPAVSTEMLPAYLAPLAMVFLLWLLAVVIMLVRDWWSFRHDIVDDARDSSVRWERRLRWLAERDRELQAARRERQRALRGEEEYRQNGTLV